VMGPKQLAGVLTIVARQKTEAAGAEFDDEAFAPIRDAFADKVEEESTALFATGRMWDDGIIDPRETRTVLSLALSAVYSAPVQGANDYGVWRM
jgi:acetyl-CoA carboxylase carboxyltransferase component